MRACFACRGNLPQSRLGNDINIAAFTYSTSAISTFAYMMNHNVGFLIRAVVHLFTTTRVCQQCLSNTCAHSASGCAGNAMAPFEQESCSGHVQVNKMNWVLPHFCWTCTYGRSGLGCAGQPLSW